MIPGGKGPARSCYDTRSSWSPMWTQVPAQCYPCQITNTS